MRIISRYPQWFLAWNIDKQKIFHFVSAVSNLIWWWIIHAKNDIYSELIEKNILKANTDKEIEIVKQFINKEIDKHILTARQEMDNVVELFRQRCLEILLDKQSSLQSMLKMSHQRDKTKIHSLWEKINWLSFENERLSGEILILHEVNTTLQTQVSTLQTTVENQAKSLKWAFQEYTNLSRSLKELEWEKQTLMKGFQIIETELARKKRRLVGTSLIEKLEWIFRFTKEIQAQETSWQQTFVHQQNFSRIEEELTKQIQELSSKLDIAKTLAQEIDQELQEEQRKNQILTSSDERVIKDSLTTQVTDYFHFLFNSSELINQTKQEELELSIKMTFYRAKVLNMNVMDFVEEILKKLLSAYEKSYPNKKNEVESALINLKNFINILQYGSKYFDSSIKKYRETIEL